VGTQTGNFYGMPPTGNKIDVNGITIFRIEDNKIAELWNVWDQYTLVEQLKG
jgi:predicted ester cyclase